MTLRAVAGGNGGGGGIPAPINIATLSSDATLVVGQKAYILATAVSTQPCMVAIAQGQRYRVRGYSLPTYLTQLGFSILPNNASGLSSTFTAIGSSPVSHANLFLNDSGHRLDSWDFDIDPTTTAKQATGVIITGGAVSTFQSLLTDTTTAWTSLGTLSFSAAVSFYLEIERIL